MSTEYVQIKLKTGTDAERLASTLIETREPHITSDKREFFVGGDPMVRAIADGAGMKSGIVSLASGAESGTVTFTTPFADDAILGYLTLIVPSGGDGISLNLDGMPVAEGFSYKLGAPTPNADYKFFWEFKKI